MTTKIGLPENRARLKGLGAVYEQNKSFTEGYNAGFDAGYALGKKESENRNENG
jgi:hypothetical protein